MGVKKGVFKVKNEKKHFFPINDRNDHAMSLEICFWCQKDDFFTYVVTFNPIYARWGPKTFLRSKKVKNDKNVKILQVWAIRIHTVTKKIHLG